MWTQWYLHSSAMSRSSTATKVPHLNHSHVKLAIADDTAGDSTTSVDCFTTASIVSLPVPDAGTILAEDPLSTRLLQARPDGPFGPADDLLCTTQGAWSMVTSHRLDELVPDCKVPGTWDVDSLVREG